MGEQEVNERSKSQELKSVSEIVVLPVPPIIEGDTFAAVQALPKAQHPTVTPWAVISGPTLLTGLIHCAKCGGAITIRTGKCGRYRYYACSMKARRGPTACEGKAVSMERLDNLVASHLADRLLQPNRLEIEPLHTETVRLIYRLALHHDGAPCIGSSPRYRNEPAVLRERSDMEPQLEMVAEEAAERLDDHHIERRGLWRDCLDHALELRAAVAGRRRSRL